jgi:alkylhydroperoxidase family enzyme
MTDSPRREIEVEQQIEARHQEVLGQAPRIAPVDRESAAEAVLKATRSLRAGVAGDSQLMPLDFIHEIMFTMCRFPDLWQRMMDLTVAIQGPASTLPLRDRKLAILRTGWLCQAPYEFGEHVNQAKRTAGFTSDDVKRIIAGSEATGWDDHERAILRAVEELHDNQMVSDAVWATLAIRLDDQQLVELLVVVGQFTATAYFQNSMRLRLETSNRGLAAR